MLSFRIRAQMQVKLTLSPPLSQYLLGLAAFHNVHMLVKALSICQHTQSPKIKVNPYSRVYLKIQFICDDSALRDQSIN